MSPQPREDPVNWSKTTQLRWYIATLKQKGNHKNWTQFKFDQQSQLLLNVLLCEYT